jgi:hypothetical protein
MIESDSLYEFVVLRQDLCTLFQRVKVQIREQFWIIVKCGVSGCEEEVGCIMCVSCNALASNPGEARPRKPGLSVAVISRDLSPGS